MEAGIKGFWKNYPAITALLADLGASAAVGPYTTSAFWAPRGAGQPAELINQAPVFSSKPRLPTPLGQMVWTADAFTTLTLADRLSVLGIVAAMVDVQSSPEALDRYNRMTARELFTKIGVTRAVYRDFLAPTLQVALFAPPEQLAASDVLLCLDFYALAHQDSFDVAWCTGSVSEKIFGPLVSRIKAAGGEVCGGRVVTRVEVDTATGAAARVVHTAAGSSSPSSDEEADAVDAVVFAVGIKGMQAIVRGSPDLAKLDEFRNVAALKTIDCVSARLWFDRPVPTRFPANVLAGFDGEEIGGTFFNLNALQDEYNPRAGPTVEGCIACDWYGASTLLPLSDDTIVARARANLEACEPGFKHRTMVDSCVARAVGAVTAFSPGSLAHRPTQATSIDNVWISGDWVKGVDTKADGLSQERAYVTGLTAAGLVVDKLGVGSAPVIPQIVDDEPHVAAAKRAARAAARAGAALGLRSPLLR